jgi:hypothetical protein
MTTVIHDSGAGYFRVHDSGDMFSTVYAECWLEVPAVAQDTLLDPHAGLASSDWPSAGLRSTDGNATNTGLLAECDGEAVRS